MAQQSLTATEELKKSRREQNFYLGYYGSDPYNIYYMDSYWFWRAGIAFGFFVAPVTRGEKKVNAAEVAETLRTK